MTTEEHLKAMLGDLLVQIAMLRAEIDTLKDAAKPQPNGRDSDDAADHRPLAS